MNSKNKDRCVDFIIALINAFFSVLFYVIYINLTMYLNPENYLFELTIFYVGFVEFCDYLTTKHRERKTWKIKQ
jgi:hypothetical protein